MKEHKAIYTVEIPVKFTFKASDKLDCQDLIDKAVTEAQKRLLFADVDFKERDIAITKKIVLFTPEELKAQDEFWARVLGQRQ